MNPIANDQRSARIRTMALRTLAACSTRKGIVAGASHFSQVWTRDACFALWGSITVNDYDTIKTTLTLITDNIDEKGRVPLRVGDNNVAPLFLKSWFYKKILNKDPGWFKHHIIQNDQVVYHDDKKKSYALDSASLLIIAWGIATYSLSEEEYNKIHTKKRMESLERAFNYYGNYEKYGLLYQHPYSDWADSIKRKGYSSYNNILYYAASKTLSKIINGKKRYYETKANEIKGLLNSRLWIKTHYSDFLDSKYKSTHFSMDANMLAIIFGVADEENERKIVSKLNQYDKLIENTGLTVYPFYSNKHISRFIRLVGMKKYHNGMRWLWISGIKLMALQLSSNNQSFSIIEKSIDSINELTENNRENHAFITEVYLNKKPFSNPLYDSEEPFAWSSGILIASLDSEQKVLKAIKKIVS